MAGYIAELVGFILIIAVLWWKVVPPVKKMADERQELIGKQVEASKLASERLAEAERKYSDAVAEAHVEAAKIRDGARADAQRIVAEMREQADREVERIRQRGEDDLTSQRQSVIRELRSRIGELSVELAGQLVTEHLSAKTRQAATVDRLLDELDAMSAREETLASKGDA
jgi:ATP synthase F0 subunit b